MVEPLGCGATERKGTSLVLQNAGRLL